MSTTVQSAGATGTSSLASSSAFGRFAVVFSLVSPALYVVCELANWPLFSYHPATGRIDLGLAPPIKDEGPVMYWYGWTATTLIGAGVLGLLATVLPERVIRTLPLSLIWILPLVAIPIFLYALRSFWRF